MDISRLLNLETITLPLVKTLAKKSTTREVLVRLFNHPDLSTIDEINLVERFMGNKKVQEDKTIIEEVYERTRSERVKKILKKCLDVEYQAIYSMRGGGRKFSNGSFMEYLSIDDIEVLSRHTTIWVRIMTKLSSDSSKVRTLNVISNIISTGQLDPYLKYTRKIVRWIIKNEKSTKSDIIKVFEYVLDYGEEGTIRTMGETIKRLDREGLSLEIVQKKEMGIMPIRAIARHTQDITVIDELMRKDNNEINMELIQNKKVQEILPTSRHYIDKMLEHPSHTTSRYILKEFGTYFSLDVRRRLYTYLEIGKLTSKDLIPIFELMFPMDELEDDFKDSKICKDILKEAMRWDVFTVSNKDRNNIKLRERIFNLRKRIILRFPTKVEVWK